MLEWPQQRRSRINGQIRRVPGLPDISDDLLKATGFGRAFHSVANRIERAYKEKTDPKITLSELAELTKLAASAADRDQVDATADAVLTLACVEVLRKSPTCDTWEHLRLLRWNSAVLEQYLSQAIVAATVADPLFKEKFLAIAHVVVANAAKNPGQRAMTRDQGMARQLRDEWIKNPSLTALWQRTVEHGERYFDRDDDGILGIVADINIDAFFGFLELYDSPYPVLAALNRSGARWIFDRWREIMEAAPIAFDEERHWNGSSIVPLLLSLGRDQLQFGINPNSSDADVATATDEIAVLVTEISKVIASRPDAAACAERWGAWIVRSVMGGVSNEPSPFPANARSHGYLDATLINALARSVSASWSPLAPSEAEPWEPWCYRAVLACVALIHDAPMPTSDIFLSEWLLSPEDWPSKRGEMLKAHASIFEIFGKRADAYGTRLLALPLVENANPERIWQQLWSSTGTLREIVEFGDADGMDEGWQGRSEASGLLRLAFGLGLMIMDHLIGPSRKLICDRQASLEILLGSLAQAVQEMAAIDQLNTVYWKDAARHLAIRRAVWLVKENTAQSPADKIVLDDRAAPTFADFVRDLKGDTEGVLAFVEVALRNGVNRKVLKRALIEAGTDLASEIDLAERLRSLAPQRAAISLEQISTARSLLAEAV